MGVALTKDGKRIVWSITCPTCNFVICGEDARDSWLNLDPYCPKCERMVMGLTNYYLPKYSRDLVIEGSG